MFVEELELPWASGTFVADIWEGTGLACRQTLPGYSGFEPKISGFFWGAGTGYHCQICLVVLGDWNFQVYVGSGP